MDRRAFLGLLGAVGFTASFDWATLAGRASGRTLAVGGATAWRRSGKGRHVSRAAKGHNANHVYATFEAAASDLPHPGDKSYPVPIVISASLYQAFFGDGRQSVDLRHDLRTLTDYKNLSQCQTGPARKAAPDCVAQDVNGDGRVDLRDVSIFQRMFTGA